MESGVQPEPASFENVGDTDHFNDQEAVRPKTVLEELAVPLGAECIDAYSSNRSTWQGNAEFDDG